MKKIMFNDKYGLTAAVLSGKKTMTRRIIKDVNLLQYLNELDDDGALKSIKGTIITESNSVYKVGEIIAVAQAYKDIAENSYFVNQCAANGETASGKKYEEGWNNKMFVAAYYMPHHIRITDIKVERLQDISKEDCLREGIEEDHPCYWVATDYDNPDFRKISDELADHLPDRNGKMESYFWDSPFKCFAHLIDKVSGKGTWENNPWVFAYSFELIK